MMEESKKERIAATPVEVRDAGVLGAGIMGGGIAQLITDRPTPPCGCATSTGKRSAGGLKAAAKIWKKKVDRPHDARQMQRKLARITATIDWSGFQRCDLVIEAVVEMSRSKRQVSASSKPMADRTPFSPPTLHHPSPTSRRTQNGPRT